MAESQGFRRWAISAMVVIMVAVLAPLTAPPASAAVYDVEVDALVTCGATGAVTPTAPGGTMWPQVEVTRYGYSPVGDPDYRVSVLMQLWDDSVAPAVKVGQLSTGQLGMVNGAYPLALGATATYTPGNGVGFGDTSVVGNLALVPGKEYRLEVRIFDFAPGEQHFETAGTCTAAATSDCTAVAPVAPDEVIGAQPTYRPMPDYLADWAPNDNSICRAVWVPEGAGQDFTPQGLALVNDDVALVSGYHPNGTPDDTDDDTCTVYEINLTSGAVSDSFSPDTDDITTDAENDGCHHAGGIAIDSAGRVWLADTKVLIQLTADLDFVKWVHLSDMNGSFLVEGAGNTLWVGHWKEGDHALMRQIAISHLVASTTTELSGFGPNGDPDTGDPETDDDPPQMQLSVGVQGGQFHAGSLWTSISTSKTGNLFGAGECHAFGPGVEEFEFDSDGMLWAVFEGGTKQFWDRPDGPSENRFFPVIAQFDTEELAGGGSCGASPDSCNEDLFTDIDSTNPFCEDITWLESAKVTGGYADGSFRPTTSVSRQAIVVWLYALMGFPRGNNPTCSSAPFPDVPKTHPFCGEIDWAADQGIVAGGADGTFKPTNAVTRQALAAFLYRISGSPSGSDPGCAAPPFADVAVTHPFCGEIAWTADEGIVNGYSDGTFRPGIAVTRQGAAALLHRFMV